MIELRGVLLLIEGLGTFLSPDPLSLIFELANEVSLCSRCSFISSAKLRWLNAVFFRS